MPFPLRIVNNRDDIGDVYGNSPENILQKNCVSNMLGLLNQLNQISLFANEIFSDILSTTKSQSTRINKCKNRIHNIQTSKLPQIEKSFLINSPSYFYDNPYSGKEYLRNDQPDGLLFLREDSSLIINRRRDLAENAPDLSPLDCISLSKQNGVKCIKQYTDTDFFINEWLRNEKIKREEERQRRKQNKKKRKRHKRKHKVKIDRINKPTYDQHGNKVQSTEPKQIAVQQYKLLDDDRDFTAFIKASKQKKDKKRKGKSQLQPSNSSHTHQVSYDHGGGNIAASKAAHVPVLSMNGVHAPPPNPLQLKQSNSDTPPPELAGIAAIPPPNPMQLNNNPSIKIKNKLRGLASDIPMDSVSVVPDNVSSPKELYATHYQKRDLNNSMNLLNASKIISVTSPPPVPSNAMNPPPVPSGPKLAFLGDIKNFGVGGNKLKAANINNVERTEKPWQKKMALFDQIKKGKVQLSSVNLRKIEPKKEKKKFNI